MSAFTSTPLSPLLARLFAEARTSDLALRRALSATPAGDREAWTQPDAHRAFYARAKDHYLAVSPETGRLLYMLARTRGAKAIVEFGTSFGVSTLHLAAALRDNGGGVLIGTEFEESKADIARRNLIEGGVADLVEIRVGDALDTLSRDLPETIDFVLLDGAKPLYPAVLAVLEDRLADGALIVADNADDSPEYLAHVRDPANGYLSVPFGGDVELTMRHKG